MGGVTEIQIHEPALVFAESSLSPLFKQAYPSILGSIGNTSINMVSFFEDVGEENYRWLLTLKDIKVITLDFTRGDNLSLVKKYGFPKNVTLGAGIIDGRSIWKIDPRKALPILSELSKLNLTSLRIQASSSLQFAPWSLSCEADLISHTTGPVLDGAKKAWTKYQAALSADQTISKRIASLTEADFTRAEVYSVRRKKQLPGLPVLPTTTIGSFS